MSLPARAATLVVAFLAVVAGVIFVAFEFIGAQPSVENYTSYASGGTSAPPAETRSMH